MFAGMASTSSRQAPTQRTTRESVELILNELNQLPTLPAVAVRLLALTTSGSTSARDVVKVLESDASLTAAVLRRVRRADLGVRGKVTTIERAVTLLGFNTIRNLVLSIQLYETLVPSERIDRAAETRRELWKHSLAVACAAEMLAARSDQPLQSGPAFICGLLHDVGKIALDACLPKSFARVVEFVEQHRRCICDVERDLLGLDHTVAGKHLVSRWKLPAPIVECVWLHHQDGDALPSSVANPRLVKLIHLADDLARRQRIGYSGYQHVGEIEEPAARLGVDPSAIEVIARDLPQRMEPFCELVGLDDTTGRTLHAESLAKANRELGRLNAELTDYNRQLEVRSAFFEALTSFTKKLTQYDDVADVGVAAAESVVQLVRGDRAITFVADTAGRCFYAGLCGGAGEDPSRSVVELGEPQTRELIAAVRAGLPSTGMVTAPPQCEPIWQRCTGAPIPGPLWLLPFEGAEDAVGGVVLAAGEEAIGRFRSAPDECHALSTAIGLAVSTATARAKQERTNEELLDLNRRFRAAQKELVRARSVSMVGEMAAGAAHDLNNPLAVISGRAQMALQDCENDELARSLTTIIDHTKTAADIVTDMMHFAKPKPPEPVEKRLATVLDSLCQCWRAGSSLAQAQVSISPVDSELSVYADAEQLQSILDAVMANAVEACRAETARLQINSPSRVSDETVRIVIEDNGVGMTPDVLEHAFDPFFSSRPAGRGRGLGLSRAFRLADINGGRLWLDSTPNVGTTVTIELPARAPIA